MPPTQSMAKGDTGPDLEATVLKPDGTVQDLTGATGTWSMVNAETKTPKVTAGAATIPSPPTQGKIQYPWVAADTDTAGVFEGRFKVTLSGGDVVMWPNDGFIYVVVID